MTGRQRREAVAHAAAAARLGQQLRTERTQQGLTRAELADASGVSAATVAKLEQQQTVDPGFFTIAALSRVLDLDLQHLADLADAPAVLSGSAAPVPPVSPVSIGYEGQDQAAFISDLSRRGVQVVADVRLNAVSRRPGFSKTSLRTALEEAGISYRHFRALGNPQNNRAPFHTDDQLEHGRAVFADLLDKPAPAGELAELAGLVWARKTAVLCVERDERHCHRKVILDRLLTVPASSERAPR